MKSRRMFNWLAVLIIALAFIASPSVDVSAQGGMPPVPPVPVNGNVVVDELGWFTPDQIAEINKVAGSLDRDGLGQIGVLTKDDCGPDVSKYRYQVFNSWGIGHRGKNDGLLIAICWYGGDKEKRVVAQETGKQTEGPLPDVLTNKVAKEVLRPYIAQNKKGAGIVAMVHVYDEIYRGGDYNAAIANAVKSMDGAPYDKGASAPVQQPDPGAVYGALLNEPILGMPAWLFFLLAFAALVVFYIVAVYNGWIKPSESTYSPSTTTWRSTSSDSDSHSTSSFGGGDSGGGGSNTSI